MAFSSPVTMTTANALSGAAVELTTGNYFLLWEEATSLSFSIIKPTSGFIKSDTSLKTGFDSIADIPRPVLLDDGNVAVLYATISSGTTTLAYQIINSVGTIITTDTVLVTGGTYTNFNAFIAMDTGHIILIYANGTDIRGRVFSQGFISVVNETTIATISNLNAVDSSITPLSQVVIVGSDTTTDKINFGVVTSSLVSVSSFFDIVPGDITSRAQIAGLANESSAIVWRRASPSLNAMHSIIKIDGTKVVDAVSVASIDNTQPEVISGANHFYVSYVDGDDDLTVARYTNAGTKLSTTEVTANGSFGNSNLIDFYDFKVGLFDKKADFATVWKQ